MPGVFVAGDVRSRSIKRVASAVGEGSMAVSLIHEYLARRMSTAPSSPSPTCARSTCSTTSTTRELAEWAAVAQRVRLRARRAARRAGRRGRRARAACSRARRRPRSSTAGAPSRSGASAAPTWIGAIAVAHARPLAVRMQRRDAVPRRAHPGRRLPPPGAAPSPPVHERVMRQIAPVMAARHRRSSRTASGSRRSARWRPASPTSSTTRPRPPSARRPTSPTRSR